MFENIQQQLQDRMGANENGEQSGQSSEANLHRVNSGRIQKPQQQNVANVQRALRALSESSSYSGRSNYSQN